MGVTVQWWMMGAEREVTVNLWVMGDSDRTILVDGRDVAALKVLTCLPPSLVVLSDKAGLFKAHFVALFWCGQSWGFLDGESD